MVGERTVVAGPAFLPRPPDFAVVADDDGGRRRRREDVAAHGRVIGEIARHRFGVGQSRAADGTHQRRGRRGALLLRVHCAGRRGRHAATVHGRRAGRRVRRGTVTGEGGATVGGRGGRGEGREERRRRRVGGRRRHRGDGGAARLDLVDAATQVRQQALADGDIQTGGGGQVTRHFGGAVRESGAELVGVGGGRNGRRQTERLTLAQFVQVAHRQFENVGLFQFGQILALGRQCGAHQFLEFVQTAIDACAAFAFQHGFHNLKNKRRVQR